MAESLNVIALISGGKDSFFSILHCLQNGHKVVALGNLHPESPNSKSAKKRASQSEEANEDDEHDLNSFMYQTVGHSVIPLYEKALGIPLYRQPIIGTAVQTGASYSHFDAAKAGTYLSDQRPESGINSEIHDETESLVPLLRRIMEEHPCANALSTGAILSTYQRTRVESVALRLGLTPLSYLWKYPILPPGTQASLLQDMQAVGLDARIVKVASGGLDEGFLWENVASQAVTRRIEISMKRFATDGDGAVLGEGGEFETLVLDGPGHLFKGIITVQDKDRRIIREGGGSEWLQIKDAMITMKSQDQAAQIDCRVPEFLEDRFQNLLALLSGDNIIQDLPFSQVSFPSSISSSMISTAIPFDNAIIHDETVYWTVSSTQSKQSISISEDAQQIITEIKQRLSGLSLQTSNIISSLVILRSMQDFITINQVIIPIPPLSSSRLHTTPDIRLSLQTTKPTGKSHRCMRLHHAPRNKSNNPSQNPKPPLPTPSAKSATCAIEILLGPS
jgi:diphthine-ammonia ligase